MVGVEIYLRNAGTEVDNCKSREPNIVNMYHG